MPFIQDDQVVQAHASDRADDAFHIGILTRRSGRRHDLFDVHGLDRGPEGSAIGAITVSDHMSRRTVPGQGLPQLLGDPQGSGMGRDPEMRDPASLMAKHDEDEEHGEAHRRHDEEVHRRQAPNVVPKKRPPCL